MTQAFIK